ncbi:MAG: hypothetical protein AYK19_13715 [Theionarchaea archaeon DG-70-1]|nr:MAG: hypothetical protein AYK19_13715 [Theionarchaea archaeon DG-70-1]
MQNSEVEICGGDTMKMEAKWRIVLVLILLTVLVVLWFRFFDYESWIIHILKLAGVMTLALCVGIGINFLWDWTLARLEKTKCHNKE